MEDSFIFILIKTVYIFHSYFAYKRVLQNKTANLRLGQKKIYIFYHSRQQNIDLLLFYVY